MATAKANLKATLADAAAFRTWVGASDHAGADAHIYSNRLPAPADTDTGVYTQAELTALRPFAIVMPTEQDPYQLTGIAISDATDFAETGKLRILLEQNAAEDPETWETTVDGIITGIKGLAGKAGYLDIANLRIVALYLKAAADDIPTLGDFQQAMLELDWGHV